MHAINLVLNEIIKGMAEQGWPAAEVRRSSPVVPVADNFDRLFFPTDNISRSSVYTRYTDPDHLLRTHTSSMIPDLLLERPALPDRLMVCPGICFRRDIVDRTHCGEPHQLDIWRIKHGELRLEREALLELIRVVIRSVLPDNEYRCNEVEHPYTIHGLEVEVNVGGEWLELLECGEARPQLLDNSGLPRGEYSGLAMGIGLDRLVMLVKGVDDIRLLRARDPRVSAQMLNLEPYQAVSKYPPIRHDMSICVPEATEIEDISEQARQVLGDDVDVLESIELRSSTGYDQLPPQAIERMGMREGQKNLLVRFIFRSHERSLVQEEANIMRDNIYDVIHQGTVKTYASRK
ncbi:hypothetical protein KJ910_00545 [Patescibacteria group bacterium]|nr:hypothetical protein [Patescibacteria group bacterium]MBU1906943.1 hypothetical protein [Patescibacteria group bacterium]